MGQVASDPGGPHMIELSDINLIMINLPTSIPVFFSIYRPSGKVVTDPGWPRLIELSDINLKNDKFVHKCPNY